MDSEIQETCVEIEKLTKMFVAELGSIWANIFRPDECKDNLKKLLQHVRDFYKDLKAETLEKKDFISAEIAVLKKEAGDLARLLKTNIELPQLNGDTPLLVLQSEMDKSLADLRACLRERRDQICELLLEQETLCEELGEPPRPLLADPLPTADEINDFRNYLDALKEERSKRMQELSALRREIKANFEILEMMVNTETEDRLLHHRQINLHTETFNALKAMKNRTTEQVKDLYEKIDGMRVKLEILWDRLGTSPGTRNKTTRHTEYSQLTFDVLYEELQRCEELKSQNIQHFIKQIRKEIQEWWDKTLKSNVERLRFSNFQSSCYTDDLLLLHEMELEDLKQFYETNKNIFELYNDRKILWDRMVALEAKASEPGRYNNRGGQLLREEKERKTIACKLPKIEKQLTELVEAYEQREHAPFTVHGNNILDVIASDWKLKQEQKEQQSSARKQAQLPLSRSHINTPNFGRNNSTASLRKTPSTTNLHTVPKAFTLKRKLNPSEINTPMPKRSLMQAFNSPTVFLKPGSSVSAVKNRIKSPVKPKRVISTLATTGRRRSGHLSGGLSTSQKRRSLKKKSKLPTTPKVKVPQIQINDVTDDDEYDENDTYESFQNRIEPAARSSMIQVASGASNPVEEYERTQRRQQIADMANKNAKPRLVRPTSKQQLNTHAGHGKPSTPHSPSSFSISSRKLTTKNLPIII